jgi:sugar phosphate isomerase/epimerase
VSALPLGVGAGVAWLGESVASAAVLDKSARLKLSCNLYSFNAPLQKKQMTLEEVLKFCADVGFDAVDPTGYYFPTYPTVPDDTYVYRIKQKAYRLGLDISGTGIRNDFTLSDVQKRKAQVELVKKWSGFAAHLGAPILRVFSGPELLKGYTEKEVTEWVIDSLRECAEYGASQGVMIVLQNHADFIRTAEQMFGILHAVGSDWLAANVDTGSFQMGDPYAEIAKIAPHAASWLIKENVTVNGKEQKLDLKKIVQIVREVGYRGYLRIETLGEEDPRIKVPRFLAELRQAVISSS